MSARPLSELHAKSVRRSHLVVPAGNSTIAQGFVRQSAKTRNFHVNVGNPTWDKIGRTRTGRISEVTGVASPVILVGGYVLVVM